MLEDLRRALSFLHIPLSTGEEFFITYREMWVGFQHIFVSKQTSFFQFRGQQTTALESNPVHSLFYWNLVTPICFLSSIASLSLRES